MSIWRTPTPNYEGQPADTDQSATIATQTNLCDRVASLFRTPTPAYDPEPEPADDEPGNGCDTEPPQIQRRR